MRASHSPGWLSTLILTIAFAQGSEAQIMATSGPIPPNSLGLPPLPPFLTLLGMASPGRFVTDPSIAPKGPVSEVFYEELRGASTPSGLAGTVEASNRTKFDLQGRITEQIEIRWGGESDTIYHYRNDRLVSTETTFPGSKKPRRKAWSYWSYNASGKLTEYRRGAGTELQNHELNFTHDAKGRLLAFEIRQGIDDTPFSVTKISYSDDGNTIDVTIRYPKTKIVDRSVRFLDNHGRVVRVALSSEGRDLTNEAKAIRFRYDEKGRLIEQTTDAVAFSDSGAEHDLPPGTVSILYDDHKHMKTTTYSFAGEGTMRISLTQDDTGATTAYSIDGGSKQISSNLKCEYDSYGNWTNCSQLVEQGGQKFVKQRYRRDITYRPSN